MNLTNQQIKDLKNKLDDIINNIDSNIEILSNEEISNYFLRPILNKAISIQDQIYLQTKDVVINITLDEKNKS